MMRNPVKAVLVIVLMQSLSAPVWALDAETAQTYCNNVKQASIDAQNKYVLAYKPPVDPGKVFDDATSSCLDFITNFQVSIPSIWDGVLMALAKQLLQRVCQTARAQFDQAVNGAVATVNGTTSQAGVTVSSSGGSSSGQGVGVSGSVKTDNGSQMQNTVQGTFGRVINMFQ